MQHVANKTNTGRKLETKRFSLKACLNFAVRLKKTLLVICLRGRSANAKRTSLIYRIQLLSMHWWRVSLGTQELPTLRPGILRSQRRNSVIIRFSLLLSSNLSRKFLFSDLEYHFWEESLTREYNFFVKEYLMICWIPFLLQPKTMWKFMDKSLNWRNNQQRLGTRTLIERTSKSKRLMQMDLTITSYT